MSERQVYCVYAKVGGLLSFLFPWVLVGISDEDRGVDSGYGLDCLHRGMKILRIKTSPPLQHSFHFVPKGATILYDT